MIGCLGLCKQVAKTTTVFFNQLLRFRSLFLNKMKESLKTTQVPLCISLDFFGLPSTSIDFHGLIWTSIDFARLLWTSVDFNRLQWTYLDFHRLLWTSLDFTGLLDFRSLEVRFFPLVGETRVVCRSTHLHRISLLYIMTSLKLALIGAVSKNTLENRENMILVS